MNHRLRLIVAVLLIVGLLAALLIHFYATNNGGRSTKYLHSRHWIAWLVGASQMYQYVGWYMQSWLELCQSFIALFCQSARIVALLAQL